MNKVICIHPIRSGLRFLRIFTKQLSKEYDANIELLRLKNNDFTHDTALNKLNSATNDFVIFLCHGVDNHILGCRYNTVDERNAKRYFNENFINFNNINVLKSKNIFFFSCNSRDKICKWAINNGALSAIGFGLIRFDYKKNLMQFNQKLQANVNNLAIISQTRYLIRKILLEVLTKAILENLTIYQVTLYMNLIINKVCEDILFVSTHKKNKHVNEIVKILQEIKYEMKAYGNVSNRVLL